jgi:subtilisin family serine protease
MKPQFLILAIVLTSTLLVEPATAQSNDAERDILVTFDNQGARALSTAGGAPYRNRKRYSIAAAARRSADDVRDDFSLVEVDHWPIRSLSVYCFVYRIPPGKDRETVIARLQTDERVESVQPLQEFETGTSSVVDYDDTYANLQRGLSILDVSGAHRISRGHGVRIAIIDSDADHGHEDLRGRLSKIAVFVDDKARSDAGHGTAVASVIGANANNAKGIVGIAPQATLELFVSCWAGDTPDKASCDSFTLAKALDTLLDDPPDVLNMSLTGPFDPLLARLLGTVQDAGVVIVAARPADVSDRNHFPASLENVIGVGNSEQQHWVAGGSKQLPQDIYAPGKQIMVAVPNDSYDFRSGSSLAAAHVSGTIALLLAVSPDLSFSSVLAFLRNSQNAEPRDMVSINACLVLQLADPNRACQISVGKIDLELKPDT